MKKSIIYGISFLIIFLSIGIIYAGENFKSIEIKEVIPLKTGLNLSYTFDNLNIVGENIAIEIWITNEQKKEIKKIIDFFPINKEGKIKRNLLINAPLNQTGIYYVNLALSSNLNNFVKQSFILEESKITGKTVLNDFSGKVMGGVILTLTFIIGLIFMIKNKKGGDEGEDEDEDNESPSNNKWLIKKKRFFEK